MDSDTENQSIDLGSSEDEPSIVSSSDDGLIDFSVSPDLTSENQILNENPKLKDKQETNSSLDWDLAPNQASVIKVIGVGGGGSNAVNYMISEGIRGVDFIICNTDSQALERGQAPTKIQLGVSLTEGLGAGENPSIGEKAAVESENEIREILIKNTKMLFITAGMGGGTGTGAAPIIAKISKELDILTIGIVTVPFSFEGPKRFKQAQEGIEKMREYVDSLVVINNDKLVEVYGDLGLKSGFAKADETLMVAARGISEVITQNCLLNIDLNDAKTVLKDSGTAIMGSGKASGPNRSEEVVKKALDSPLLNDNHIKGANKILLLILSGKHEITIKEIGEINHYLQREAGGKANIILGVGDDSSLEEDISITIIATGVLSHDVDPTTGYEERKIHSLHLPVDTEDKIELSSDDSEKPNDTEKDKKNILDFSEESNTSNKLKDVDHNIPQENQKEILNKNLIEENLDGLDESNIKRAEQRKKRLQKFHNLNFKNQVVLKELEDEPAYKRQGTELDEVEHSSTEPISRIILDTTEEEPEIKNNNSFLHDNVD